MTTSANVLFNVYISDLETCFKLMPLCRGGWWPSGQDLELFDPEKVGTTRYRYRGSIIPTPWPISGPLVGDAHPVRAGLVESPVH